MQKFSSIYNSKLKTTTKKIFTIMTGRWSNSRDPQVQDFVIGLIIGVFACLMIFAGIVFNHIINY